MVKCASFPFLLNSPVIYWDGGVGVRRFNIQIGKLELKKILSLDSKDRDVVLLSTVYFIHLSIGPFIYPFDHPFMYSSIYQFVHLSVHLSIHLFVFFSVVVKIKGFGASQPEFKTWLCHLQSVRYWTAILEDSVSSFVKWVKLISTFKARNELDMYIKKQTLWGGWHQ